MRRFRVRVERFRVGLRKRLMRVLEWWSGDVILGLLFRVRRPVG